VVAGKKGKEPSVIVRAVLPPEIARLLHQLVDKGTYGTKPGTVAGELLSEALRNLLRPEDRLLTLGKKKD